MQRGRRACVWIVSVCASIAMPGALHAQTFEAGLKAGIVSTGLPHAGEVFDQVQASPTNESSSRIGVSGGGYVRFPITDRFGFEPEVLFAMKGVQTYQASSGGTFSARINYLDIPLLMRYRVTSTESTDPPYIGYALAGPAFGIKLSSSAKFDGPGNSTDLDIDPALKSLDLGLTLGGGIEFKRYLIEGRFTAGLTDVASTTFPHLDSLKNRTVSVLFGMKLPIGK